MVVKSKRLRWARRVARMEDGRVAFNILNLGIDGRTILKQIRIGIIKELL